jgi:hypothetical protein
MTDSTPDRATRLLGELYLALWYKHRFMPCKKVFCAFHHRLSVTVTMRLIDRLLDAFTGRGRLRLQAAEHPNDLMATVNAIRALAYLKITGKTLTTVSPKLTKAPALDDSLSNLSPVRRLARREP